MGTRDDLEIPLPAMAPSYRVAPQRRPAMDPATRRLATFAGVIGGSLLLLVGVWSFTGHRHAGVPVIEADSRPVRVKPANPGGLQVAGANDGILSGESDGKPSAAPPPEAPAPQALKAEEQAAAAKSAAAAAPPPAPAATATAAATPAPDAAPAAMAAVTPEPATPAPASRMTVRPESQPLPPLRPHVAQAAPRSATPGTAAPAPTMQASLSPPPARSLLGAASPAHVAAARGGTALVQLAAVGSEKDAMSEWERLSRKYPDLLGGRRPTISKIEHGGRTYWRLRTGGFGDVAQAEVFCERVKSHGGGCAIASF